MQPPALHLTQPVFEDVLDTSTVGVRVVSGPLFELLARAADPDVGLVSHPVDVAHPSDGTVRSHHLMRGTTTIVETVVVPADEAGLITVRRSAFPTSSARRLEVSLPDRCGAQVWVGARPDGRPVAGGGQWTQEPDDEIDPQRDSEG